MRGRRVSFHVSRPDPVTSWTGWDIRGGASAGPAVAEEFAVPCPSDVAAGGRYELLAVAGRGFRPPRFLSAVDLSEDGLTGPEVGVEQGIEGMRQTWSLLYRKLAETGPPVVAPYVDLPPRGEPAGWCERRGPRDLQ